MNKGETRNAHSYFKSNTGYRFITKAANQPCFKVSVPKPEGGYQCASVGYLRIGERRGMRKAINLRNKIGEKLWGKYWNRVRTDFTLLARLPRSLEPRICQKKDSRSQYYCYDFMSDEYDEEKGRYKKCHRKVSIARLGRLAAYIEIKRKILAIHRHDLELLKFMNRNIGIGLM
ncbi:Fe3+-citrate ABC transporter substrate-binding protein [Vibrio campbellii]|uniref:Fe3+-citrate ABC transporter substrate-binding protein n=1 Tax=Vibrio campbellii TaxID=680 RepID=UPI00210E9390|nr:Fe3+-citrate ABC transporter substrate-binding protein [Vibrio campbellii]UTZ44556.1 Fe3+-citrate ABC transporter substrate-binding protein [Vibrio campbellii]